MRQTKKLTQQENTKLNLELVNNEIVLMGERESNFIAIPESYEPRYEKTGFLISAFVFRYTDSTISRNYKPLAIFCGCTARFVSDLVGNPEDRFSHNEAHIYVTVRKEKSLPLC